MVAMPPTKRNLSIDLISSTRAFSPKILSSPFMGFNLLILGARALPESTKPSKLVAPPIAKNIAKPNTGSNVK